MYLTIGLIYTSITIILFVSNFLLLFVLVIYCCPPQISKLKQTNKPASALFLSNLSRTRALMSKMLHIHIWKSCAACRMEAKLITGAFILLPMDFSMGSCSSLQHDSWF